MPDRRIRTLLIEDSAFMRILISDMLRTDKRIEIVATANNGLDGVDKACSLKPDVVITDMVMPEYDGIYVVKTLMKQMPVPIILLSSLDKNDEQIFEALNEGAMHFFDKPKDRKTHPEMSSSLTALVSEAAKADVTIFGTINKRNAEEHSFDTLLHDVIVVGASTGGPGAIEFLLSNLPRNLRVPVIIIQHMPQRFIETFAERLNVITDLNVKVASVGEIIENSTVYLVPATSNTALQRDALSGKVRFTHSHRTFREYNYPSVDSVFDAVAEIYGDRAIGVLLTGMGRDGANGLLKMKERKALTIVQDEESSVVFGMPLAAIQKGAAAKVLPLSQIPAFIVSCM